MTIDLNRLADYLSRHIEGFRGPIKAEKFEGGQSNPTYRLDTAGGTYVLRQKPPGNLLKSAHAVDREFRIQRALAETEVPVARMFHLCEDEGVTGSIFYVMDYVAGRIFWDPALPEMSPADRERVYDEMNRVLAAIHNVDIGAAGLSDYGRPGDYFARQLKRWTGQYRQSETEDMPAMNRLIAWLEETLPVDDGRTSIVHGDYRIDNLLFAPEKLEVMAVFDWELSTLGIPWPISPTRSCNAPWAAIGTSRVSPASILEHWAFQVRANILRPIAGAETSRSPLTGHSTKPFPSFALPRSARGSKSARLKATLPVLMQ